MLSSGSLGGIKRIIISFGVILGLLISIVGVSAAGTGAASRTLAGEATYTPEELFFGIYFGTGRVGTILYPELADNQDLDTPEMAGFESKLFARISRGLPDFFEGFQSKVQSGQHLSVLEALEEGKSILSAAIASELDLDPQQVTKAIETGPTCAVVFAIVVAAGAGVVVAVGAGGAFWVAAVNWFWFWTIEEPPPVAAEMHTELLVNDIVELLAL